MIQMSEIASRATRWVGNMTLWLKAIGTFSVNLHTDSHISTHKITIFYKKHNKVIFYGYHLLIILGPTFSGIIHIITILGT